MLVSGSPAQAQQEVDPTNYSLTAAEADSTHYSLTPAVAQTSHRPTPRTVKQGSEQYAQHSTAKKTQKPPADGAQHDPAKSVAKQ
jgi:hypothetical protein